MFKGIKWNIGYETVHNRLTYDAIPIGEGKEKVALLPSEGVTFFVIDSSAFPRSKFNSWQCCRERIIIVRDTRLHHHYMCCPRAGPRHLVHDLFLFPVSSLNRCWMIPVGTSGVSTGHGIHHNSSPSKWQTDWGTFFNFRAIPRWGCIFSEVDRLSSVYYYNRLLRSA